MAAVENLYSGMKGTCPNITYDTIDEAVIKIPTIVSVTW